MSGHKRHVTRWSLLAAAVWLSAVVWAGYAGLTTAVPPLARGPVVLAGILGPFLLCLFHPAFRAVVTGVPDAAVVAAHSWRALAGFAFLDAGDRGLLPGAFVRDAGYGDILVALLVPVVLLLPESRMKYVVFHLFGLADFLLAVGTGLVFTLADHPLIGNLFAFPLVVIPWFGVGLSGASHLAALHRLLPRPRAS